MKSPLRASKNVLITGVSGFIGRAVARHFTQQQHKVYGIDRIPAENAPLEDLQEYGEIELPNPRLTQLLADWQPDALIHCAGRASVPEAMQDPGTDFWDGPVLTFELLEMLRKNRPACTFILLSSAAVYGDPPRLPISEALPIQPLSAYGYHKWQSETLCAEFASVFGLHTASARVFSAYGPGLRRQVMWDVVHKALTQSEVRLQGTGEESRDFIHMQDIARGLEIILSNAPACGEAFNLASGTETRIADLAQLILQKLNQASRLVFSGELPPGTPKNWRADIQNITRLGFRPQIALDEGVSNFVAWCRNEIQGA
jgi:UDP-glucose 4-epimerase